MRYHEFNEQSQAQRKAAAGVEHDQFFTRPEAAKQFADWVKSHTFYAKMTRVIEPAAGNQDLARHFPGIEMYDLDPQHASIQKQDFLTSTHSAQPGFLVVMNPPFGKRSDLAVAFFNKASQFAEYIAMIVPRTFRRDSIQNQLNRSFHLVDEYVLPRGSFYLPSEGPNRKYDVPAVAQIWQKQSSARPMPTAPSSTGYSFVRDWTTADFAIRSKGRRAGQLVTKDLNTLNPNSFFFVKGPIAPWQRVNWSELGNDVMGARSISKTDIAKALSVR